MEMSRLGEPWCKEPARVLAPKMPGLKDRMADRGRRRGLGGRGGGLTGQADNQAVDSEGGFILSPLFPAGTLPVPRAEAWNDQPGEEGPHQQELRNGVPVA